AERHAAHPLGLEDVTALLRGFLEEPGLRRDGAAHADHAGQPLLCADLRPLEPIVPRGRTAVPHPWLAPAAQPTPARDSVAPPLAHDTADQIEAVGLSQGPPGPETGGGQPLAPAPEPVGVQPPEVHAPLDVLLHAAGRLQRAVPAMARIDVLGADLSCG